jgi:hypothetical protein
MKKIYNHNRDNLPFGTGEKGDNALATLKNLNQVIDELNTQTARFVIQFTNAVNVGATGAQHGLNFLPTISIFDVNGQQMFAKTAVNTINYNILVTFNTPQSGYVILS